MKFTQVLLRRGTVNPLPNSLESNLSSWRQRDGSSRADFPNVCKKVFYFIFYFFGRIFFFEIHTSVTKRDSESSSKFPGIEFIVDREDREIDLLELIFLTFVRKFPISYSISSFFKRIFFFEIHKCCYEERILLQIPWNRIYRGSWRQRGLDLLELIFLTFVRKFPILYSISSFFKRIFFFGIHTSVVAKRDSESSSKFPGIEFIIVETERWIFSS